MKLYQAFNIVQGDVVAFIGGGGKTSTLISLGYELAEMGWRVLATTTLRIRQDELELTPRALTLQAGNTAISAALSQDRFVFLYDHIRRGEAHGLSPESITDLLDTVDSDVILVEADHADGRALKAPYVGEPIIPTETTLVIQVMSLSILGKTLDEDHVYNLEAIVERYGFPEGTRIKSPWVAQILRDEELGLKDVPKHARVITYINQTGSKSHGRARARHIARMALRNSRLNGVAIGAARGAEPVQEVQRPIGAVVLAAGLSTRMGEPKMLLPWGNKTIIEHILDQLINARLEHITVVTGHMAREIKDLVKPLGVDVVYNRGYKTGEMLSSLKAGLRALPDRLAATLIVLGDQPRLQPKVLYQIMSTYAESSAEILIPSYEMRRGHPILINRRYWPEILNLPREGNLREVINAHSDQIQYVNVDTDSVLRDVDTPEDYSNERWRAGL
ncbi:MAG: molybdenum cofactor cytidylyltransferase [Anaerolineae bacterium]